MAGNGAMRVGAAGGRKTDPGMRPAVRYNQAIIDRHGAKYLVTGPVRHQPESSTQEVLAGLVERVTFHNSDNGFCVLREKARGHRDLVTVVGHAAIISAGEWITASGEWVNDHTHGQQFKARFIRTSAPTSIDGIEKYLGSGMIRGIGPVYAKKMINAGARKAPFSRPPPSDWCPETAPRQSN